MRRLGTALLLGAALVAGCEGDTIQGTVVEPHRKCCLIHVDTGDKIEKILGSRRQWEECTPDEQWPACQKR